MNRPLIVPENPLPADIDWQRVAGILGVRIFDGSPDREVVNPAVVCESEPDLLRSERQVVDGLGERSDVRVRVGLQGHGPTSGCLAVLDALQDQVSAAARHGDSSTRGRPESVLRITVEVAGRGCADSRTRACGGAA